MLKKCFALVFVAALVLAACHSPVYNQTEANIADVAIKTAEARQKSDTDAKPKPALVVKKGLYVDTSPINLEKDPRWLKSSIVIRGDQLPFSYYSRVIASGAGTQILTKYQVGLDPATQVTLNYSGSIKGALDLIASRTGYVYSINHNTIYWQAYVTKTFDVAFMPGGTDYLMGKKGDSSSSNVNAAAGGGGSTANYVSSDASESEYSSLSGTLSIWKDLDTTIKQMLSPGGTVVVSESTTSVTVKDKPSNVELIGQYIANLNQNLSKQVLVKVQVLQVNLENDFNFGIDWGLVAKAFSNTNFILNSNNGTPLAIQAFNGAAIPQLGAEAISKTRSSSYNVLLNALGQQGKTSVVSEPRTLCLNNQVCVIRIAQSEGYLASVQNTTLAGASGGSSNIGTVTSQLTPGVVVTGLTLYVLPKILNGKVYLQVNADLSRNNGFNVFPAPTEANPSPSSQIQLPNITQKHFNQRSMIQSGDTLILSGFRELSNRANASQFLQSQALGGKGAQELNTETVVLITPIVLNGSV